MSAVYNENDPAAAAWLRELINEGQIAPGDVDERSIKDVRADDYRRYAQVHCFGGIGLWSAALRRNGWDDERPVGTGSCPCQPFSAAGKNLGFTDQRHLWPDWRRLIVEAREQGQRWTDTIFGEQVATAGAWLDLVRLDLEALGYAFGSVDLPAAGFAQGAHIRQRLYWVADRHDTERWADVAGRHFGDWPQTGRIEGYGQPGASGATSGLADPAGRQSGNGELQPGGEHRQQQEDGGAGRLGVAQGVELDGSRDPGRRGCEPSDPGAMVGLGHHQGPSLGSRTPDSRGAIRVEGPTLGATGSLRGCDWLLCHDARIRPVESKTFPLAATSPGRLGLLRGYGNGLDLKTAVNFVGAYMESAEIADTMRELT